MSVEPKPPARSTNRLRLDLLVGAAVLVGVLLVGKLISGGNRTADPSSSPSASVPSPSTISVGPSTIVATPSPSPTLPAPQGQDLSKCPSGLRCYTQQAGNGLALAPVKERYPRATIVQFRSVRILSNPWAGALWYRKLQFRINGELLDITVTAPYGNDLGEMGQVNGRMYVRFTVGLYRVTAMYPAEAGVPPGELRGIATDDRLLTT